MSKSSSELEKVASMKPWIELMQAKSFLAGDFLLWLWYFAESKDNPIELDLSIGVRAVVKIWIEDRLVLESQESKAHSHILKGGEPSRSSEAESALKSGKAVKELRLGMHIDPYGDFLLLLTAKDLSPKSVILPGQNSDEGKLGLAYKLKMTEVMLAGIDGLFARFLEKRTEEDWRKASYPAIREWILSRGNGETHLH